MSSTQKKNRRKRGADSIRFEEEQSQPEGDTATEKSNLRHAKKTTKKALKEKKKELSEAKGRLRETIQKLESKNNERKDMVDMCKMARARVTDISAEVCRAHEDVQGAHLMLRNVLPRNEVIGLHALNRVIRDEGVICGVQYFGPVIGNITLLDARYYKAVEAAAKSALFHVIVDTKATAMKLIKRLEKEGRGQVTFLPLDQLKRNKNNNSNSKDSTLKYPNSPKVVPLLKKCIKYNPKLEKAMHHVFGRKLFSDSTEIATHLSTQYQMDVVTIEGDLCCHEGVMSSNTVDTSNSIFDTFHVLNGAIEKFSSISAEEREMKEKSKEVENQSILILRQNQELEAQKADLEDVVKDISKDVDAFKTQLDGIRKKLKR